jgi:RNA polymerase sigma factor (sigma-70 family)
VHEGIAMNSRNEDRRARFEGWIERFGPELYGTCLRRLGGRRDLAEELMHEIYLVAWRRLDTFDGDDEGARHWLHRIAFNLTPAVWRRNPHQLELTPELLERHGDPVTTGDAAPGDVARLRHCLGELEPLDRSIVEMRYGLRSDPLAPDLTVELSWAEVAGMVTKLEGRPFQPDQGRMRASRALRRLKDCMEARACAGEAASPKTGEEDRP